MSDLLALAYSIVAILVNKGYHAGVAIGATDVSIVIQINGSMLSVAVTEKMKTLSAETIAGQISNNLPGRWQN